MIVFPISADTTTTTAAATTETTTTTAALPTAATQAATIRTRAVAATTTVVTTKTICGHGQLFIWMWIVFMPKQKKLIVDYDNVVRIMVTMTRMIKWDQSDP